MARQAAGHQPRGSAASAGSAAISAASFFSAAASSGNSGGRGLPQSRRMIRVGSFERGDAAGLDHLAQGRDFLLRRACFE